MIREQEEIEELFRSVHHASWEFVRLVSSFTETQINAFPFRGGWTAAQVAEHLTRSNLAMVESLKSQEKTSLRQPDQRVQELREQFLDFDKKVESHKSILPTKDIYQKESVIRALETSVRHLIKTASSTNLFGVLNHPIFGDITKLELLHFALYDTERHVYQLRDIFQLTIRNETNRALRKVISFMHVSVDGFVAGPNGEMNWITMDDEIFEDVLALAATTDTALYGRSTYQMMESYWPSLLNSSQATKHELRHATWLENVNKIVFSTSMEKAEWNNTKLIKNNIVQEVVKLKQQPGGNMMIFGSPALTHSFIQMDLIDEYRINLNPVVLGNGVPLFKNARDRIDLTLLKAKTFESGVIGLHYKRKHE